MIDHETLLKLVAYDAETGIFTWKARPENKTQTTKIAGRQAGTLHSRRGHITIGIFGRKYYAHRLAWFYAHGAWPSAAIDHKNGNASDNRLSNLRVATVSQNIANSRPQAGTASGVKGVKKQSLSDSWMARITVNRKEIYLGTFKSKDDAAAAYAVAAKKYFGEFARHC